MKHFSVYSIILLSVIQVACTRETDFLESSEEMSFTASISKSNINTKSTDDSIVIPFGDGMTLTIEESDIEDNYEDVATKGQVVTTENFSDLICRAGRMHITAFDRSTESSVPFISDYFKYDGQYWRPLQSMYWPNYKMDIYAFARPVFCWFPYDEEDRQDIYYPDSDVMDRWGFCLLHGIDPVNRTLYYDNGDDYGHEDLLFAKAESDPNHSGPLNLSFKHILTAVKFVTSSGIPSGTVKDISIRGIYGYEAIFHLDTEEWEFDDSEYRWGNTVPGIEYAYYYDDYRDWDYNHHLNVETSAGVEGTPISNEYQTLFVYPQKCGADSYISIDFQYNGETDVQTYDIPLPDGFEFKMGKQVTFSIGASGSAYSFSFAEENFSEMDYPFTYASAGIPITSIERPISGEINYSAPWKIASYQVGENAPVEVNSEEVNTGDLLLKRNGNLLQVTDKRVAVNPSTHEYWTGANGDWSPTPYSGDPIDLSRFDAKTETADAFQMTTANCYIIRHAGTYKLPLVYGNAVVNGIENVEAYYPAVNDTESIHQYACKNFPNFNGTPISSAFIENNEGCIPTGCAIIWQDNGDVVSNLEIVGDEIGEITESNMYDASTVRYLQFKVDQSTIHQGNALICIYKDTNPNGSYDIYDEAIWSWHIWITNNPDLLEQDIQITPQFTPDVYYFPIYCLGWIDPDTYLKCDDVTVTLVQDGSSNEISFVVHRNNALASTSHGTFYEYGRPDPFYNNSTWKLKTNYLNAWTGYDFNSHNIGSQMFIKTIYDPSPTGYMLPKSLFQSATYHVITGGGSVSRYKTIYFTGSWDNPYGVVITDRKGRKIFFPRTGYRGFKRRSDDEYGIYVSSVKYNPSLSFKGSELISGFYNDDNVMYGSGAVRPVKQ